MAIETQQAVGIGAAALPGTGAGEFGAAEGLGPETSQARDIWRRFRRNKLAMFGLVVVILEVLGAVFAPLITFYDPDKFRAGAVDTLLSPSGTHWFGTDQQGRDLFTRVVYGARVSLEVGIIALIIALAVGLTFGAIAGYYGRFWDALLMRTPRRP